MKTARVRNPDGAIRPMHPVKAILYFGLPALITNLLFWKAIPVLDFFAPRLFFTFLIEFGLLGLLFFLLSLSFYRSEGNPWKWEYFLSRFRLRKFSKSVWLWAILLVAIFSRSIALLRSTTEWIQEHIQTSPKYWARMIEPDPNYFMEMSLENRALLMAAYAALQIFFTFGSELWWRGYVFRRQELQHGRSAWVIHALFWTAYESFMIWQAPIVLLGGLAISYVTQREQTIWPGIIARTLIGFPSLIYPMKALFFS